MQHPFDVQGRQVLAAERFAVLRGDAISPVLGSRRARRRFGALLTAAGARLASESAVAMSTRARRV